MTEQDLSQVSDEELLMAINDQLILLVGETASGKSASLREIRNQERWLYLGTEAGKRLPFRNNFDRYTITDPYQVHEIFDYALTEEGQAATDGIIIDSLTFWMDMYEALYIQGLADGRAAWGEYAMIFRRLMIKIAQFGKPVIVIAHTKRELDEASGKWSTGVPVKGALKNNGIEAYFSCVIAAKRITLKELEKYSSGMLEITEREKNLGFKYVFQTLLTKETTGDRIRGPMELFADNETYVDNNIQAVLDRLNEFYA